MDCLLVSIQPVHGELLAVFDIHEAPEQLSEYQASWSATKPALSPDLAQFQTDQGWGSWQGWDDTVFDLLTQGKTFEDTA